MIKLPQRATAHSAAYDFFAPANCFLEPNSKLMIWTDVKVAMEPSDVLLLNVRSSMGKHPVMLANTQGWIDPDYFENPDNDGNIGICLYNLSDNRLTIKAGERIAQGLFINCLTTDDDNATGERTGGFGSTGK